jgi:hypothetical protein
MWQCLSRRVAGTATILEIQLWLEMLSPLVASLRSRIGRSVPASRNDLHG